MFILVVLGQPVNQQVIDGFGRFLMQKVPDPGYFPKVNTGRKILRAHGELEKICANAPDSASRKRQCWHRHLEAWIGQIA